MTFGDEELNHFDHGAHDDAGSTIFAVCCIQRRAMNALQSCSR
jgi:hypothetical protein